MFKNLLTFFIFPFVSFGGLHLQEKYMYIQGFKLNILKKVNKIMIKISFYSL